MNPVQVYLPDGSKAAPLQVRSETTLREILRKLDLSSDVVVFTDSPENRGTPMVNLDKCLPDYNMWHLDKSYICEISVFNINDVEKYDSSLYCLYIEYNNNRNSRDQ